MKSEKDKRFHIDDIRVLIAISIQLYVSLLTIIYSILQGIIFEKTVNDHKLTFDNFYVIFKSAYLVHFVTAVLIAIIGLTQLRLFWFLYVGWRYKSLYLLRIHFILSLYCIFIIFISCIIASLMDLYGIGPFQFMPLRNHIQSHILVAFCSLVPFIIGFNASWRFYNKITSKLHEREFGKWDKKRNLINRLCY